MATSMTSLSNVIQSGIVEAAAGAAVGTGLEYAFSSAPVGNEIGGFWKGGLAGLMQLLANVFLWKEYVVMSSKSQMTSPELKLGGGLPFFATALPSQPLMFRRLEILRLGVFSRFTSIDSSVPTAAAPSSGAASSNYAGPDNASPTAPPPPFGGEIRFTDAGAAGFGSRL